MTRRGILLGVAFALAGCGRRGALEPPPDPNATVETEKAANPSSPIGQKRKKKVPIVVPKDPFFLDPIL